MHLQRALTAVQYTGIMSVARRETIDGRPARAAGAGSLGHRWVACAALVLGLALAVSGAVAAEGGAVTPEGYEAVHLGGPCHCEVIDGLAVYDGDIVLGPADGADGPRFVSGIGPAGGASPRRRDAVPAPFFESHQWPNGVIPYEIDLATIDTDLVDVIEEAIDQFNRLTVLRWVPRTAEDGFVRFTALVVDVMAEELGFLGRAHIGTNGRGTSIWISPIPNPGRETRERWLGLVIHEMGHTVGLWHGHDRIDAPNYLRVAQPSVGFDWFTIGCELAFGRGDLAHGLGPFDYASVMQYPLDTRPSGIPLGGRMLSVGDIDAINRMYGKPPQATTISTHPPRMIVTVDGVDYRSPVAFRWSAGSQHTLSVPGLGRADGSDWIFARWSDGGSMQHTVTADPNTTTWFTAYYASDLGRGTLQGSQGFECSNDWPSIPSLRELDSLNSEALFALVVGSKSDSQWWKGSLTDPARLGLQGSTAYLQWAVSSESRPVRMHEILQWCDGCEIDGAGPPITRSVAAFGEVASKDPIPRDVTLHASATGLPTGTVPIWFGIGIPEVHRKYGITTVPIVNGGISQWVSMVPVNPDRILIEDQPREFLVPGQAAPGGHAVNRYLVPYWADMDGLTVDIISSQAEDLIVSTNLPVPFRRTPAGFTAVVDYPWGSGIGTQGELFRVDIANQRSDTLSLSGTLRVHSVKWRRGPARIIYGRTVQLFVSQSSHFSPQASQVVVYNVSRRPARVRLESDQFRLATAPDVLLLDPMDGGLFNFYPLPDGLEPGIHEGTVRLVPADSRASSTEPVSEEFPVRLYVKSSDPKVVFDTSLVDGGGSRPETSFYYGETIEFEFRPSLGCFQPGGEAVLDLEIGGQLRRISGNLRYSVRAEDRNADGPVSVRVVGFKVGARSFTRLSGALEGVSVDGGRLRGGFLRVRPPSNGEAWVRGESIELTYSARSNALSGTSEVALDMGGRIVPATLSEVEGSELHFGYVVQDGDRDADGLAIARAVIRTADGAEFDLHDALGDHSARSRIDQYLVDGSRRNGVPHLKRVRIRSDAFDEVLSGLGAPVGVDVEFDYAVEVTGSPELGLEIGGRRVRATLAWARGRVLSFIYTVRAEDSGVVTLPPGALLLTGGAVRGLDGQAAVLDLAPGAFAGHSNSEWRVDGSEGVAFLTGVEVDPPVAGDTFSRGEQIRVVLHFSAPVAFTGIPRLAVQIGGRIVQLVGDIWRPNTLVFSGYAVQAEDRDVDGISIYDGALSVYGGYLSNARDESSAVATNLGWHAIANSPGHKVNGSVIRARRIADQFGDSRTLAPGDRLEIHINWPEYVTVTLDPQREPFEWYDIGTFDEVPGAPQLALVVGNRRVTAIAIGGLHPDAQPTNTLAFHYRVQAGDFAPDGIEIPADGLSLNGATIRDRYGVDVDLDLSHLDLNRFSWVVVARRPAAHVTGVKFIGKRSDLNGDYSSWPGLYSSWPGLNPPHDSTYRSTSPIFVEVRFSNPVRTVGEPRLALVIGDRQVEMVLVSSSEDGKYKVFRYIPQAGDRDDDGLVIPSGVLPITGGTFGSDPAADLTWDGTARSGFRVDGDRIPPPRLENVSYAGAIGDLSVGAKLFFNASFDRAVHVTGSPQLALEIGGNRVLASLDTYPFSRWRPATAGTTLLRFRYEIRAGDSGRLGIPASPLSLNGGAIRGIFGDDAVLAAKFAPYAPDLVVGPDLADVIPQLPSRGWIVKILPVSRHGLGDPIDVCLNFRSPVVVTGRPRLALEIGARRATADFFGVYTSGLLHAPHGGRLMCFRYTVQAGDRDLDGLSIPIAPLSLNGGTIRGPGGKDALVLLQERYDTDWVVDGSRGEAPRIHDFGVRLNANVFSVRRSAHVFGPGDEMIVEVVFDRPVQVTGSPQLALEIGDRRVQAGFLSPTDRDRPTQYNSTYYFRYVVQAGDRDEDGVVMPADGLSLNGGSIGNGLLDAVLDGGRDRRDSKVKVGVAPTIINNGTATPYIQETASGQEMFWRVEFNDLMEVTGRPTWAFELLGRRVEASFSGVMGASLCFKYSFQPGDLGEDSVITVQPDALSLNGGSIRGRHADARLGSRPWSLPVNRFKTTGNKFNGYEHNTRLCRGL